MPKGSRRITGQNLKDSVTRFFTLVSFHQTTFPGPYIHTCTEMSSNGSNIRGVIHFVNNSVVVFTTWDSRLSGVLARDRGRVETLWYSTTPTVVYAHKNSPNLANVFTIGMSRLPGVFTSWESRLLGVFIMGELFWTRGGGLTNL